MLEHNNLKIELDRLVTSLSGEVSFSGSFIIPCHNESLNIDPLYHCLLPYLNSGLFTQIIFVDDASTDDTADQILRLKKLDSRVKFIRFNANKGHQIALYAGLKCCDTKFALTMDADMQHPPNRIIDLLKKFFGEEVDVVIARRSNLQTGYLKNTLSKAFYNTFSYATSIKDMSNLMDFACYGPIFINLVKNLNEPVPFFRGMVFKFGLNTATIDIEIDDRKYGTPSYTFMKSFKFGVNALLDFSHLPYKFCFFVGVCGILISLMYAVNYTYLRVLTNELVPGQADLLVLICLSSSSILLMLSLILRILLQILKVNKKYPEYTIRQSDFL
jgi:polyisoprenyl-phosphate glycosyltransferase